MLESDGLEGITEQSAQSYIKMATQLRNQFDQTNQIFTPAGFAKWLVDTKLTLEPRTWRFYRAAVNHYLSVNHPDEAPAIKVYLAGFTAIKDDSPPTTKPPRKKAKSYTEKRFQNIIDYLQKKVSLKPNSIWWVNALYTMLAGDLVGLRPVEWEHAKIETVDGVISLVVKNAKTTHGRSHGETRTLDLSAFEPDHIATVQKKIDLTRQALQEGHATSMLNYHENVRTYIKRANRAADPKAKTTIPAYSTRHQLAANLKHEGVPQNERAAQMGHRSNETADTHYGRRKNGRTKSNLPRANPADVARVEAFNAPAPTKGSSFGPGF